MVLALSGKSCTMLTPLRATQLMCRCCIQCLPVGDVYDLDLQEVNLERNQRPAPGCPPESAKKRNRLRYSRCVDPYLDHNDYDIAVPAGAPGPAGSECQFGNELGASLAQGLSKPGCKKAYIIYDCARMHLLFVGPGDMSFVWLSAVLVVLQPRTLDRCRSFLPV